MGGGGFSMEPDNLLLDRYVCGLTGKDKPRVCFLPTASGDAQAYVYRFHRHFKKLTKKQEELLRAFAETEDQQVLPARKSLFEKLKGYVAGGEEEEE